MKKPSILSHIKFLFLKVISFIGWKLFLFGSQTTQEQYWEDIYNQEKLRIDYPNPVETYGKYKENTV